MSDEIGIVEIGTRGIWRIKVIGDDLIVQKKENGVWVTKGGFTA